MRHRLSKNAVMAALGVLAVVPAVAPANAAKPKKVTCMLKMVALLPPGATSLPPFVLMGHQFGLVSCGKPLGQGIQSSSFSVKLTTATTGTVSGSITQYYKTGTFHGTYSLNFTLTGGSNVVDIGTSRIVGGSGAFQGAKGKAKFSCTSPDRAIHHTCTIKLRLRLGT